MVILEEPSLERLGEMIGCTIAAVDTGRRYRVGTVFETGYRSDWAGSTRRPGYWAGTMVIWDMGPIEGGEYQIFESLPLGERI